MAVAGDRPGHLAIPIRLMVVMGSFALVQDAAHPWRTWIYASSLVLPTAVGHGWWLTGWWADRPRARHEG